MQDGVHCAGAAVDNDKVFTSFMHKRNILNFTCGSYIIAATNTKARVIARPFRIH